MLVSAVDFLVDLPQLLQQEVLLADGLRQSVHNLLQLEQLQLQVGLAARFLLLGQQPPHEAILLNALLDLPLQLQDLFLPRFGVHADHPHERLLLL